MGETFHFVEWGELNGKEKKKQISEGNELSTVIQLQKSLKLKCPNIKINYFNDIGWGVRCKKKITEGEVLIALPLQHLITTEVDCEVFKILKCENKPPQFVLSIFLIYESHLKEKSKYYEYILSLPKSYLNPYFCTKNEIRLLPEFIRNEVVSQITLVDKNAEELFQCLNCNSCPHCGEELKNIFTHEKFIWAWFTVNTRSVYYQDKKQLKSMALAPFLDLFNHSSDAVTKLFIDFENELYILKSLNSFKKFEQVFIKYGAHTNLKLFLEYGFILPDNENDFVEFCYEEIVECIRKFDSNFGEISKLKYNFIKSNKLNQNLTKGTEFSWNLQGLVYMLTTTDQDLSVLQSKTYSNLFTTTEKNSIKKISEIISKKKSDEFHKNLIKMNKIQNPTKSFQLAKNLIKNYIKILG